MLKVEAKLHAPARPGLRRRRRPHVTRSIFNARTFGSSLRCSVCQVVHGCLQGLATPNARGLILDGLCPDAASPALARSTRTPARFDAVETLCVLARTI